MPSCSGGILYGSTDLVMESLINVLMDYANSVTQNPQDAGFAKSLAYFIANTHTVPSPDEILGVIGTEPPEDIRPKPLTKNANLKFRSLHVKHLRKFANKDKFFRLDFISDSDNPVSCVYVGHNGVGKTSLYHALEITMLGSLESIANIEMDPDEKAKYMHNIFSDSAESGMAIVETVNDNKELSQLVYRINGESPKFRFPSACLCSGRDIETLIQHGITKEYVAEQLNLSNMKLLTENLEVANDNLTDRTEILTHYQKILIQCEVSLNMLPQTEESQKKRELLNKQREEYIETISRLQNTFEVLKKTSDEKAAFVRCLNYMRDYYINILRELAKQSTKVLNNLVSDFLGNDISSTEVSYTEPYSLSIKVTPRDALSSATLSRTVSPAFYLNNFRQKLFYVAFKAALFLYAREKSGNDYPFIIDDIFDSSDFENREKVKSFMNNLHSCYIINQTNGTIPDPVQVILFTHDDIIAEEAYKGIQKSGTDAKFARIFEWTLLTTDDFNSKTGSYKVIHVDTDAYQSVKIEDPL